MSLSDPLGDMLTRIRNGQQARKDSIVTPASRLRGNVLNVLKKEGYIRAFSVLEDQAPGRHFKVELKYHDGGPVIREISRVSKPGRRVYSKVRDIPYYYGGLGTIILSTPRGVMSDAEARSANVGGEILCQIF